MLDELLTQSLASFMAEGFIDREEIIVDGTKACPREGVLSLEIGEQASVYVEA